MGKFDVLIGAVIFIVVVGAFSSLIWAFSVNKECRIAAMDKGYSAESINIICK